VIYVDLGAGAAAEVELVTLRHERVLLPEVRMVGTLIVTFPDGDGVTFADVGDPVALAPLLAEVMGAAADARAAAERRPPTLDPRNVAVLDAADVLAEAWTSLCKRTGVAPADALRGWEGVIARSVPGPAASVVLALVTLMRAAINPDNDNANGGG
jgi:hypothetical protein